MNARIHIGALVALMASALCVCGEGIDAPSPQLLRFMQDADQVYIFPNPHPQKQRIDTHRLRLLPPKARRELVRLLGRQEDWYIGVDDRVGFGPPPKDIGLLFRRGGDELVLFFSPGELIDARFNGQRQGAQWSPDKFYDAIEGWKTRYAQPELTVKDLTRR